jgi:asparagine synthase (glutamine-hydrolysing)
MMAAKAIMCGSIRVGNYGGLTNSGATQTRSSAVLLSESEPNVSRHAHGDVCLLIIGHCLLDDQARAAASDSALRARDFGRVMTWPGAFSAIFIRRDSLTAYADPSDQFPLYYSRRDDMTLLAADPAALAAVHRREPDPISAAANITCPTVYPLWRGRSHYAGIGRVPAGARLDTRAGAIEIEQRDAPLPVSGRSLEEGAAALRAALLAAIQARCESHLVAADFSGGLDSTSIAFLASASARSPVTAVAYHQPLAPADDLPYATRYATLNPRLALTVVTGSAETLPFSGLNRTGTTVGVGEPHPGWLVANRSLARLTAARRSGARLHLTGEGGDAILMSAPSYLATLARHGKPVTLLRHSGAYARLRGAAPANLAGLAVRLAVTTGRQALSRFAADLANTKTGARPDKLDQWGDIIAWWPSAGQSASWLTARIRQELAEAVGDPETARAMPPGAGPADLAALSDVRRSGDAQRQLRQLAAPLGLETQAPFLDSAVICAALSVPAPARASPWTYKPLLGEALGGLVPAEVLTRRTKGDYASEDYVGARAALSALHAQLRDSRLAALGVIEPMAVMRTLDLMATGIAVPLGPLNALLAVEAWLRSRENERS